MPYQFGQASQNAQGQKQPASGGSAVAPVKAGAYTFGAASKSAGDAGVVSRGTAPEEVNDGFLKTLVKDPIKTLLVKPAIRTSQAVTAFGVRPFLDEEHQQRLDEELTKDKVYDVPILGKYKIEAVKPGTKGAGQIAGEALKAGSYLYGGQGAANVGKSVFGKAMGTAVSRGIGAGAATGAMYGAGEGLEEGDDLAGVAGKTATGAVIGGVAGGAVPFAIEGATKFARGLARTPSSVAESASKTIEKMNRPEDVRRALSAGIDDNVVNFIDSATPDDARAFKDMLDVAEKGSKDLRFRTQPKEIAGKTILESAKHLIKVKDIGVGQTNQVLNKLDQSPVDTSYILYQFLDDMKNLGITVVKRGKGYQLVSQGKIPQGDMDAFRLMLSQIMPDNNGQVMRTYRGLHVGRQRLFNELNLSAARQKPFSTDAMNYAEKFRRYLAEPINQASKNKYQLAQKKTAESMSALRDFVQLMGYKGNLENITAKDLRAAEVGQRVLGNAADRPMSVLSSMDEIAQKYGYKPKGNYLDQLQMADIMEDVFGSRQTRALRGQVKRAGLDAVSEATGAAQDVASGNVLGLGTRAIRAITGRSDEAQVKAFKELVNKAAERSGATAKPSVFGVSKGIGKMHPKAPQLAESFKTNAIAQLQFEGNKELATKLAKLDTSKVTDHASLSREVRRLVGMTDDPAIKNWLETSRQLFDFYQSK